MVAGVAVPSAWIGGLEGRDLIGDFASGQPLLEALVAGIEDLRVDNGTLHILLAR